jgi:hypothetical protein
MADTGFKSPGTMADDSSVGAIAWGNVDNAKLSDNNMAGATLGAFDISHYLKATNFSMGVPAGATINGIEVTIECYSQQYVVDNSVKIVKGGSISGDEKSLGATWPNPENTVTFGGATNLWGLSWSVAEINSSDFGFVISAYRNAPFASETAQVDHIQIKVYYTPGAPPYTSVNIGDAWKTVSGSNVVKVNVGDVWKNVTAVKVNVGDVWKAVTII